MTDADKISALRHALHRIKELSSGATCKDIDPDVAMEDIEDIASDALTSSEASQ